MPVNKVEDRIHYLYQLDNSPQGQHSTLGADGSWTVHNYNQSAEKQIHINEPLPYNLKICNARKSDSVRGGGSECLSVAPNLNNIQLNPILEFLDGHFKNKPLSTDGYMFGHQNFLPSQSRPEFFGETKVYDPHFVTSKYPFILNSWQENACGDSPTLTTNSERSEITEASFELNFLGAQQLVGRQPVGISQTFPMQQSEYSGTQLLQQQLMLKQLQEIQRQQQIQQFGDAKLQNSSNHVSLVTKQADDGQFSPLINGTPINDASLMFMNWVQQGASPATQGVSNSVVSSQEQVLARHSMGLVQQQLDVSLYGNPIANARGSMNQYFHHQGTAQDSINLLTRASGQTLKPLAQSSAPNNHFLGDHIIVSADQVCLPPGGIVPKPGFQEKQNFGQVPFQGLSGGFISGNLQPIDSLQTNSPIMEIDGRHERVGWPGILQQNSFQLTPSPNLVPLDPMEEKILYNMDDDIWGTSFGMRNEMGAAGLGSMLENTDNSNAFPSLQSGSWSALMQSAVAEASSNDAGLQEEWSGLTFQNTELSNDNQASNIMDNERQQENWLDSNLQTPSSLTSTPFPMFTDSSASSDFPGFQQPGIQFLTEQTESTLQDSSHVQRSPGNAGIWSDSKSQQRGDVNQHAYKGRDSDGCLLKEDGNYGVPSFLRSTRGSEQVLSGSVQSVINRKGSQLYNYLGAANSSTIKGHQGISQQVPNIDHLNYGRHLNNSMDKKDAESMRKFQYQIGNGPDVLRGSDEGKAVTYDKKLNCYQRDNVHDTYNSKFTGDVSDYALTLDKGSFPDFQGNSNTSEELPSGGDLNVSGTLHEAVGSNVQSSLNMLELLHKVDEFTENSSASHINSPQCNSSCEVPDSETGHVYVTQAYHSYPASQGYSLRLAPPSQRLSNLNAFIASERLPQVASTMNLRQDKSEIGSLALFPPNESAGTAQLASISSISGLKFTESASSMSAVTSSPQCFNNELRTRFMSTEPVRCPSLEATYDAISKYSPSNLAAHHEDSRQTCTNPYGEKFPALETLPVSQSPVMTDMSRQGGLPARSHNVLRSVPIQGHGSGMGSHYAPHINVSNDSTEYTSSAKEGLNNQMLEKDWCGSSEFGVFSKNSPGFECGRRQPGKEVSQQILSESLDASQTSNLKGNITDANASSFLARVQQQGLDKMQRGNTNSMAASQTNLQSVNRTMHPSDVFHHNYSLLHQVQAIKNVESDPNRKVLDVQQLPAMPEELSINEGNLKCINSINNGQKSTSFNNLSGDTQIESPLAALREDLSARKSLQPSLQDIPSQQLVLSEKKDSQSQYRNDVELSHAEQAKVNLSMPPLWFKQYGASVSGLMRPFYDARIAKNAAGLFPLGNPFQGLYPDSSLEEKDAANAIHSSRVLPEKTATLALTGPFPAPYELPSDVTNQSMSIVRPQKRKTRTSELLPWYKEVTHGSGVIQNISVAEQDWAQATNRLFEKVEDDMGIIEDERPRLRSKRRLILTTQLMQQLFGPPPGSVLSEDSSLHYDSVVYFVAKLSLGDACSQTYHAKNDLCITPNGSSMFPENIATMFKTNDQSLAEVVNVNNRAKKLETDLLRLDKAASVLDIRVECQELERFSVINRFAKFHIRQADTSATSSSSGRSTSAPKTFPQKYVNAYPMPKNLPEDALCLSL
ncbi:putative Heat shock protein [Quillaja saponaria]|uniref:Heat shock protein n=1 Tax=Quillaja saponaria TaxID=32244 RepID=A0AAD7PXL7_QUISA|nr:putative Heat shock protein [Quillaja saponaria]KAJ7971061.1 putative Heat shock protein [Quillaja saponaria]